MNNQHGNILFYEEQKFRQKWLLFLIIPIFIILLFILIYSLYQQLYLKEPFGNNPMSDKGLIVFSFFIFVLLIGLIWLLIKMKLNVLVKDKYLYIRFYPFIKREIQVDDIESYKAIIYNPLKEYGGWGIRVSIKGRGMAYNVSGNSGVDIRLKNGKRFLIGSQRSIELASSIKAAKDQV